MRDIRIAIVGGGGFMGKAHSLAYSMAAVQQNLGVTVHKQVLVDLDDEIASKAAADLGWNESSSDWRAVIARDDIDIIDITTPPHTHAEIALAAMAAGKHVLSEKPITNDATSALELWEAAKVARVKNQVGFNYRNGAAITLAKKLISEGRIGEPLQIRISYVMAEGFSDLGWRKSRAQGASGASGDIGSHIIDIAEFLLGDIAAVSGKTVIHPQVAIERDADDSGVFAAQFANGALGSFSFNIQAHGHRNHIRFEIDGTEGGVMFDWNHRDELQVYLNSDEPEVTGYRTVHLGGVHAGTWFDLPEVGSGYLEASANQLIALVDAIVNDRDSHPNFGEAAHVQLVVEALEQSSETGRWVDVPARDLADLGL